MPKAKGKKERKEKGKMERNKGGKYFRNSMNEFERCPHNNQTTTLNKHIKNCVQLIVFAFGLKECLCVCARDGCGMGKWTIGNHIDIFPCMHVYYMCVCVCYLNHITNSFPASWPTFTRSGINSTINYIESNLYASCSAA